MHTIHKAAENKYEVVFVSGSQIDPYHARVLGWFDNFEDAASYVSYLNGGSEPKGGNPHLD